MGKEMIIYLMVHFPFIIIWKIGFAQDNVFARAAALDKEVWGFFQPVCFIFVPFAHRIEKWFHRKLKFLNVRFYKGNGSTETYLFPAAIPVLAFMLCWWGVCVWAIGKAFGFDGIAWYVCFLKVLWGWAQIVCVFFNGR